MHTSLLEIRDGKIHYQFDGSTMWELPIKSIRVFGEATNDHGPYVDDYFFCFATSAGEWYEASFYAEGREEFLRAFGTALECELTTKLVASTDFNSNVLWPPHLAGLKMFTYE